MSYENRLLSSKIMMSFMVVIGAWPLISGAGSDRADLVWVMSLPILAYLLWGGLHGTGRSVRMVGFLGLVYAASFFVSETVYTGLFPLFLLAGFAGAALLSIRC